MPIPVRVVLVRSGYVRLVQVNSGYNRIGKGGNVMKA
jgi:hypothetical protein